jgi:hypothetical protein
MVIVADLPTDAALQNGLPPAQASAALWGGWV